MGAAARVRGVLLLSLLCAGLGGSLHGCHGAAAHPPGYVTVSAASFTAASTCNGSHPAAALRRDGTSAVLRLAHRHGPCAPSWASSLASPSIADTLLADQRRAEYILRRVSGAGAQQLLGSEAATVPANWGYDIGTLNYVATVSLGTPGVVQTMEVDTGSDLSWVQCKPCAAPSCYSQKDPLFDPTQSSSYSAVPCGGSACAGLGIYLSSCSSAGQCGYAVRYGDGSNTTGVYSSDTLTLTGSDAIQGFLFGCGSAQTGLFNGVDGLLGLGRQAVSLVGQTASTYGGVFSYCLPTKPSTTGYLTLGGPSNTQGFSTTQLLSSPSAPAYYIVMMTGISVGTQQLSVPPSAFAGGTVVDSGTVVTRLPPTVYAALRAAFRSGMAAAPHVYPAAPSVGILDTCYNFAGYSSVTIPNVVITFSGGATMALNAEEILSFGCLAFAASGSDGGMAILGNAQQRSFEVRFDGTSVGFKPNSCD